VFQAQTAKYAVIVAVLNTDAARRSEKAEKETAIYFNGGKLFNSFFQAIRQEL
jgi:hypothetical protein